MTKQAHYTDGVAYGWLKGGRGMRKRHLFAVFYGAEAVSVCGLWTIHAGADGRPKHCARLPVSPDADECKDCARVANEGHAAAKKGGAR